LQSSALENALSSFSKAGSSILSNPKSLYALSESINNLDLAEVDITTVEGEFDSSAKQLNSIDGDASFLSVFTSLPPLVQALLFYFFIHVLLPQINSISANLLTPTVESFLKDNDFTERETIKKIKRLPLRHNHVSTDSLRFITGNNVRLRSESSTRSEILDELVIGQIVTVVSKNKNWIEVMYEYDDGELKSGWVFTRYTAKFVK